MITLPHNYVPRSYQIPVHTAFRQGKKRLVMVDHRRCGKDKTCFNITIKEAFKRVGVYYYFFPTYNQGRKILWDGVDKDGFRFMDHVPKGLIHGQPNSTEMKLSLIHPQDQSKPGSLIQIVGTDNIDSVVGSNPVGCVFSEYALQDPRAWDYMSPILLENGGWAMFPYTPRGKNHGYRLAEMAKNSPDWYYESLTVEDTIKQGGTMTPEMVESERERISAERGDEAAEAFIQQEYFCSFESAILGAVYGTQFRAAVKEGRITNVPYDPAHQVTTYWDIGFGDPTAIWFVQEWGSRINIIDYYANSGVGVDHYARVLQQKPYVYSDHYGPHDVEKGDPGSGKTYRQQASDAGIEFTVVPRGSIEAGINAGRAIFNRCWFDAEKCKKGLDALSFYHYEFDERLYDLSAKPVHDWSSHAADSFRTFAMGHDDVVQETRPSDRYAKKKPKRSWMSA